MANKKIKNAEKDFYDNIHFKSHFEVVVYKTLKEAGFNPFYERKTYTIWNGFRPRVLFFNRVVSKGITLFKLCNQKIRDITYTPDFYIKYANFHFIIEAKGYENDVFPLKKKIFRKYLENLSKNTGEFYVYFEVRNKREVLKTINIIKNIISLVKMLDEIKKRICFLSPSDRKLAESFINARKFEELQDLVLSAVIRLERKKQISDSEEQQLTDLQELNAYIVEYNNLIGNENANYLDCLVDEIADIETDDDDF